MKGPKEPTDGFRRRPSRRRAPGERPSLSGLPRSRPRPSTEAKRKKPSLLRDALIAVGLTLIAFGAFRLIDFLGLVLKAP
jgi:hypothetical protein